MHATTLPPIQETDIMHGQVIFKLKKDTSIGVQSNHKKEQFFATLSSIEIIQSDNRDNSLQLGAQSTHQDQTYVASLLNSQNIASFIENYKRCVPY